MKLNCIHEHTSCINYKARKYDGFLLGSALQGERFDNHKQDIKANHLIFLLSGAVNITKDERESVTVRAGEFVFIPLSSHYVGVVIQAGSYIDLAFFHDSISLCDKYMLSRYLKMEPTTSLFFEPLAVREPLDLFLKQMEIYLRAGVNCKFLHEIKERELFIIFRTAYTKAEILRLFHPIMGVKVDFKAAVLQHKDHVGSKKELAQLLGMSDSDLQRKFKQEFGEPVYAWLRKEKNKRILARLSRESAIIKDVMYEFGFSSAASFNKYCKSNFGYAPSELKKQLVERKKHAG